MGLSLLPGVHGGQPCARGLHHQLPREEAAGKLPGLFPGVAFYTHSLLARRAALADGVMGVRGGLPHSPQPRLIALSGLGHLSPAPDWGLSHLPPLGWPCPLLVP